MLGTGTPDRKRTVTRASNAERGALATNRNRARPVRSGLLAQQELIPVARYAQGVAGQNRIGLLDVFVPRHPVDQPRHREDGRGGPVLICIGRHFGSMVLRVFREALRRLDLFVERQQLRLRLTRLGQGQRTALVLQVDGVAVDS